MSEKDKNISDEIDDIIKNIENDVKLHKNLLEDINNNANKILEMLEIQDENILEIKESQEHWRQIADNTKMIAHAISQYGEQNLKLIDVVVGKKQVPTSIFILVVTFLSVIGLALLVFFTGVKLKVNDIEISKGYEYGTTEN
jgi:hypothetical protein